MALRVKVWHNQGTKYTQKGFQSQDSRLKAAVEARQQRRQVAKKPQFVYIQINLMRPSLGKSIVIASLLLCMAGCGSRDSSRPPLEEGKFVDLYVALLALPPPSHATHRDSALAAARSKVYSDFGTTEGQYRATVEWYRSDPELWKTVVEDVVKRLGEKTKESTQQSTVGRPTGEALLDRPTGPSSPHGGPPQAPDGARARSREITASAGNRSAPSSK